MGPLFGTFGYLGLDVVKPVNMREVGLLIAFELRLVPSAPTSTRRIPRVAVVPLLSLFSTAVTGESRNEDE